MLKSAALKPPTTKKSAKEKKSASKDIPEKAEKNDKKSQTLDDFITIIQVSDKY